jgi:pre-mRNA-processing factor 19
VRFTVGAYAVSTSLNGTWSFHDVARNTTACTVASPVEGDAYLSAQLHPDGIIIGTGTRSGLLRIWDVRAQTVAGTCDSAVADAELGVTSLASASNGVSSVSFSENGYIVAAGYENGYVRLWDLRKLKCSKRFEGEHSEPTSILILGLRIICLVPNNDAVGAVAFDFSGVYLGIAAGNGVSALVVKEWPVAALVRYC